MNNLASSIELYLKRLLDTSPAATILLQRKELATHFQCVPSQINYVLSTRFTAEKGYLVESRRGGGGFLRIRRIDLSCEKAKHLFALLRDLAQEGISSREAAALIERFAEARLLTGREARMMQAALCREGYHVGEVVMRRWRAAALASMLEVLLYDL